MTCVLDACAMIAYPRSEPGAEVVSHLLKQPAGRCAAHAINLCEVYYHFFREADRSRAEEALSDLTDVGVVVRRDLENAFLKQVGDLKGTHRIALADAFAIALALAPSPWPPMPSKTASNKIFLPLF